MFLTLHHFESGLPVLISVGVEVITSIQRFAASETVAERTAVRSYVPGVRDGGHMLYLVKETVEEIQAQLTPPPPPPPAPGLEWVYYKVSPDQPVLTGPFGPTVADMANVLVGVFAVCKKEG